MNTLLRERLWFVFSVLVSAGAGWAWMVAGWGLLPPAGPLLSLLLIPLVISQRSRRSRFAVALAYYLAGSHGIPQAAAVFFGPGGHLAEGVALWLASSVLLAAGWAFVDSGGKAIAVLLFDALMPPLAFFDWMSPLAASGVLFPGTAWLGIALLLMGVYLIGQWMTQGLPGAVLHTAPLWFLGVMAVLLNVMTFARAPAVPEGWRGLDLHSGPSTTSVMANFQRMDGWMTAADQHPRAKVILLPETLLTWWPGNAQDVENHVPRGQTWLVGASVPLKRGVFADGIEAVTRRGSKMVLASALPVPVSMWRPWHRPTGDAFGLNNYKAFWFSPVVTLAGKRVWASICYDQLLPAIWMEAALYHPEIILLTNNEWWAKGTGIPQIQTASSWAWGRLTGAATIEAENR